MICQSSNRKVVHKETLPSKGFHGCGAFCLPHALLHAGILPAWPLRAPESAALELLTQQDSDATVTIYIFITQLCSHVHWAPVHWHSASTVDVRMDKTYRSPPHSLWCRQECWGSGRSNRCGEVERKDITIVGLKGGTQEAAGGPWVTGNWMGGGNMSEHPPSSLLMATHLTPGQHICLQVQTPPHWPSVYQSSPCVSKDRTQVRPLANASPESCFLAVSIGVFQTQGHDPLVGWEIRSQPVFLKQNVIY